MDTILFNVEGPIARINLNRPEIHNAFNEIMLSELIEVFTDVQKRKGEIRVVILTGNGKSFCAGADLHWMRRMVNYSYAENVEDSKRLSECLYRLYTLPSPLLPG